MNLRLPLIALLALSACAPGYGSGRPRTYRQWADGPLDARLFGTGRQLRVDVNQPAYVAVFEIAPGRGVGLVYPQGGYEANRLISNSEWVDPYVRSSRSRWLTSGGLPFYQNFGGPTRFYLLIASRRPLNTTRFLESPLTLQRALGIHSTSSNEMEVLDALVSQVVPRQPDADWTTDVLPVWSDQPVNPYGGRVVRVICPDGTIVVAPSEFVRYACRRQQQNPPPAAGDTTHAPGQIARPGGRRPVPSNPSAPPGSVGAAEPEQLPARRARPSPDDEDPSAPSRRAAPTQRAAVHREPRAERTEPRREPARVERGSSSGSGSSAGSSSRSSGSSSSSGSSESPRTAQHPASPPR